MKTNLSARRLNREMAVMIGVALTALAAVALLLTGGCASVPGLGIPAAKMDATDGMVLGIVPDKVAAEFAGKFSPEAATWLSQQADMAKLAQAFPAGTPLHYGIREKGKPEGWIDLANYEQVMWFDPIVRTLAMPAPDLGGRVRPVPVIPMGEKPVVVTVAPSTGSGQGPAADVPAVTPPPAAEVTNSVAVPVPGSGGAW